MTERGQSGGDLGTVFHPCSPRGNVKLFNFFVMDETRLWSAGILSLEQRGGFESEHVSMDK